MKKIAVANQKGGVGKTTTTMNVAAGLVQRGKRVLCIDFDSQANLSDYLGYDGEGIQIRNLVQAVAENTEIEFSSAIRTSVEKIDYIPSGGLLAGLAESLASYEDRQTILKRILENNTFAEYDYVLIDCPPSLGTLLTNALVASDAVLVPVQAQKYALDGLSDLLQAIGFAGAARGQRIEITGVLLTMDDDTGMARGVHEVLNETFPEKLFPVSIKRRAEAANSTNAQISMVSKNPFSRLGMCYQIVADEIIERSEGFSEIRAIPLEQLIPLSGLYDEINAEAMVPESKCHHLSDLDMTHLKLTVVERSKGYVVLDNWAIVTMLKASKTFFADCIVREMSNKDAREYALKAVVQLRTENLQPYPNQMCQICTDEGMPDMCESIAKHGIRDPMIVRQTQGATYQILSGYRRWTAAKLLKLEHVPCIVLNVDDQAATRIAFEENA